MSCTPGLRMYYWPPIFVEGLDHFEAKHIGPYGEITSAWKRTGKKISYLVTIPANATASVTLPLVKGNNLYLNKKKMTIAGVYQLKAGTYQFDIDR
jgi:alpha-L-rhamnosidase